VEALGIVDGVDEDANGITVTPISRPLVKGAEHFLWQHWLPIFLICRFQLPCSNRARFFG
jgi:hypothetical protein